MSPVPPHSEDPPVAEPTPATPGSGSNSSAEQPSSDSGSVRPSSAAGQSLGWEPPSPEELSRLLPEYEIHELIGAGGMGAVYRATELKLMRPIAMKILLRGVGLDFGFEERFRREAHALANLCHPNIVTVYNFGEAGSDYLFLAMEYIQGTSLAHLLADRNLPCQHHLALLPQVCEALEMAHSKGIVHRDIKPANIMVNQAGRVKMLDFGLAKHFDVANSLITRTGAAMGTPGYAAPEQFEGGPVDHRADLYAMGVLLYRVLTGRIPRGIWLPPSEATKVDPAWDEVVNKALMAEPEARWQSATILREQIEQVLNRRPPAPVAAPSPTPAPKAMVTARPQVSGAAKPSSPRSPSAGARSPAAKHRSPTRASAAAKEEKKSATPALMATIFLGVALLAGLLLWSPWKNSGEVSAPKPASQETGRNALIETLEYRDLGGAQPSETELLDLGGGVKMELLSIPPGEFMLGSTKEERAWASSQYGGTANCEHEGEAPRKARIKNGFWLGRTEVTVGQWKQFIAATRFKTDAEKRGYVDFTQRKDGSWGKAEGSSWRDPGFGTTPSDDHPVSTVTWNDAIAFCNWLSEQEQKAGRLPAGFVVRLPTEVEWEYACRAGSQTMFWWGESREDGKGRLNWGEKDDGFDQVAPVDSYGQQGRNGFGLADILGNVWEWCLDGFDPEQAHEECYQDNPRERVLRGGTFHLGIAARCRCACRISTYSSRSNGDIGFRVCLGPDVAESKATADSNAPPVITNWQDVMPLVRAEMDKKNAARHEDEWAVVTQNLGGPIVICDQPLGDVAMRGRFRNECQIHLTVCGPPSKCYAVSLKSGGGDLSLRHYVRSNSNSTVEIQTIAPLRYPSANEHDFLITKVGDLLSACVDGAFAGSARDATLTSGTAGVFLRPGDAVRDIAFADLSAAAATSADAAWPNAINLLPLIDPQKDAVAGEWTVQNGGLVSDAVNYSRMEMPYQPPDEYDFLVEFSVSVPEKDTGPVQLLSKAGREFRWQCFWRAGSNRPNNNAGFESVRGLSIREGPARAELGIQIETGKRHVSMVQVRNGIVQGYVDGKLCVEWKTDYADMDIDPKWKLRAAGLIGIGSQIPTIFHRIEVREVTGKGTFTRGASNTPALQHSNPPAVLSAFCAEVAALPRAEQVERVAARLKELNPEFDGQIKASLLDDPGWAGITFSARGIRDISPTCALTWLKEFTCAAVSSNRSAFSDLSPLHGLQLRKIDCSSTRVSDLSPLRGMPLQNVILHECPIRDFSPLEGCPVDSFQIAAVGLRDLTQLRKFRLKTLNINQNQINDLSPLRGMPLTNLNLRRTKVRDLTPLTSTALIWLDCKFTDVTDFSPLCDAPLRTFAADDATITRPANAALLRSMKTLETINDMPAAEFWKKVDAGKLQPIASTDDDAFLREVAALPAEQQVARVVAELKKLNPGFDGEVKHTIENGVVTELEFSSLDVTDISPVGALKGLQKLRCGAKAGGPRSPLTDISPLLGLKLEEFNCSHTDVRDLSPLAGMPLTTFFFWGVKDADFSALKSLPITTLSLDSSPLSDLSPFAGLPLTYLRISDTKVSDLSPLRGKGLWLLWCQKTSVKDLSPLEGMPLTEIKLDTDRLADARNRAALRSITTLRKINDLPAEEFWKKVEAGEVPKP